ncbi:MAG: hypothetical protein JNL18_16265 [Planctomycetaceae bacterium]|uniref:hypothetical protein n=1 Tax=Lacipirellula limnantheis TaxID=2528024 RepID=UPI0011A9F31E|nr:hypothetical protein [Lacipirellula limnantheis]MBL9164286.1 hypothetical protein [Planctomycetaceae bacterium]
MPFRRGAVGLEHDQLEKGRTIRVELAAVAAACEYLFHRSMFRTFSGDANNHAVAAGLDSGRGR